MEALIKEAIQQNIPLEDENIELLDPDLVLEFARMVDEFQPTLPFGERSSIARNCTFKFVTNITNNKLKVVIKGNYGVYKMLSLTIRVMVNKEVISISEALGSVIYRPTKSARKN